jgi:hypothetical protein
MIFRAIVDDAAVAFSFNAALATRRRFVAIQGTVNDSSDSAVPNDQVTAAKSSFQKQVATGIDVKVIPITARPDVSVGNPYLE